MERLIFIPFIYGFGGVERLALSLSRFLREENIAHAFVTFDDTINLESHASWPVTVRRIRSSRNVRDEMRAVGETRLFRDAGEGRVLVFDLKGALYSQFIPRPCVLHLTDPPSLLPTDVTRSRLTASSSLTDLITRLKHPVRSAQAEALHLATRRGVRKAASVVVMTKRIGEELRELYGVNSTIIHPGVNRSVDRRPVPDGEALRILSISRLERTKRIDWILHALHRLEKGSTPLNKLTDWRFEIAGEGSQKAELEALARALALSDRVAFSGWRSEDQIERSLMDANLFVMPAAQGYGLPALESLAHGVPTIVHQDSGVSEILRDTPWVRMISAPDGADIDSALMDMATAISRGTLSDYPVPVIPSERDWARQIATVCGWVTQA